MVDKKDIISELKKFNDDLETHLPKLDFEFLNNSNVSSNSSQSEELLSLIASNFVDLRTEVALMRKNMMSDVEAMILRIMSEQQGQFVGQVNGIYGKILLELKTNFSSYVQDLVSEMSNLKNEFSKVSTDNASLNTAVTDIYKEIGKLNSLLSDFDTNVQITHNFYDKLEFLTYDEQYYACHRLLLLILI